MPLFFRMKALLINDILPHFRSVEENDGERKIVGVKMTQRDRRSFSEEVEWCNIDTLFLPRCLKRMVNMMFPSDPG